MAVLAETQGVLLVDEAHALSPAAKALLAAALTGEAHVIAVTTRPGDLGDDLLRLFTERLRLGAWPAEALVRVIRDVSPVPEETALAVAECANGNPRLAKRLLRRALVEGLVSPAS